MDKTSTSTDFLALKQSAWLGLSRNERSLVWKILLGYIPIDKENRESTVRSKRDEYQDYLDSYFSDANTDEPINNTRGTFKAHKLDAMRTFPELPLIQHRLVQDIILRVTWIWVSREPAEENISTAILESLLVPVIVVLLEEYIDNIDYETFAVPQDLEEKLANEVKLKLEADVYWCYCGLMKLIPKHLSFSLDDLMTNFDKIKEILDKSDPELNKHLKENDIQLEYIGYTWIYCFFARNLPLKTLLRLFDAYLADDQGFGMLHLYVFCCVLEKLKIKDKDFSETVMTLNRKYEWNEDEIEKLIDKANTMREQYGDNKV